jgi:hypothetical protein
MAEMKSNSINRRTRHQVLPMAAGLAMVVTILVGCSSPSTPASNGSASAGTASTGSTNTTTTAPTIPQVAASSLRYNTSFGLKTSTGYTATVTISRGPLEHAGALQLRGDVLGSACQVNDQTDAVVPFAMTISNTTPNFAISAVWAGLQASGSNLVRGPGQLTSQRYRRVDTSWCSCGHQRLPDRHPVLLTQQSER